MSNNSLNTASVLKNEPKTLLYNGEKNSQMYLSSSQNTNSTWIKTQKEKESINFCLHGEATLLQEKHDVDSMKISTQLGCASAAAISQLCAGATNSWTGVSLTELENDFDMRALEYALVTSLVSVGSIIGCLMAGQLMDITGRRKYLISLAPLLIVGWITIGTAQHMYVIYIGRFICGFCAGGFMSTGTVYSSETSHAKIRGRLTALLPVAFTIGVLINYGLGGFLPWRISCFVLAVPAGILMIALLFVPNSPYWLLLKGRTEEAVINLSKLRGQHYNIEPELKEMQLKLEQSGIKPSYKKLLEPASRKPLAIALLVNTAQQIGGVQLCMMFTSSIIKEADLSIKLELATLYTGLAQLVGSVISMALIDHVGRRPLLIISSVIGGLNIHALGAYFYYNSIGIEWPEWIPLVIFLVMVMFHVLGCRGLPTIISAEIFNTTIRSRANSLCTLYNRALNITAVNIFPFFREAAGIYCVFFTFGSLGLICCILIIIFVPETKGKTLEQIQDEFEQNVSRKKKLENAVNYTE